MVKIVSLNHIVTGPEESKTIIVVAGIVVGYDIVMRIFDPDAFPMITVDIIVGDDAIHRCSDVEPSSHVVASDIGR